MLSLCTSHFVKDHIIDAAAIVYGRFVAFGVGDSAGALIGVGSNAIIIPVYTTAIKPSAPSLR